jgi:hypothetical protein
MPFAKPQVLRGGRRGKIPLSTDVGDAAKLLTVALREPGACDEWSRAQLSVDPAGPWWAKAQQDFFGLSIPHQEWILERLAPTALHAARVIETAAIKEGWTWLWSQPSLVAPGKPRPRVTRPDLVAGIRDEKCLIIDIKTTAQEDLRKVLGWYNGRALRASFVTWRQTLTALGFDPAGSWVLSVSIDGRRSKWIEM